MSGGNVPPEAPPNAYAWFGRSAEALGDAWTALEVGGERLSYAGLRRSAEQLAARIAGASGGTAPRRVGLLAGRTVTAYAGYLAILRAGATVVPLNPEHPAHRLRGIVRTAGIDLVLADRAHAGLDLGVPELVPASDAASPPRSAPRFRHPGPDDIAYIIFTSGSTGAPKGVPITHRNLSAYLGQVASRYGIGPGSRVSGNFDLTFDGSVHDLFVTWARGGTLVVPQRDGLLSPVRTVNTLGLTHWFSVPSLISFADRLGTLRPDCMPTLRWSLFGGEALTLDAARRWRTAASGSRIEVLYGPTELTVACSAYRLPDSPADWPRTANGTVPIGPCFPGLDWTTVDEHGDPADAGELCVRGPQLFPGYLDPAADAGRFLPSAGEAGRWYRTGDRVSRQDGGLVHLGRTDHQVKIRGHRIELGEIESVLRAMPGVRDATVLAVSARDTAGPGGEPELAAAVTGEHNSTEQLYAELGERLPAYMLPRRITVLEQLPLTPTGKVDRRSLLDALTGAG
ncbi:D-alanine--poly(phosphoribitol) ligase [Actinomadura darangshiensis]|uniref:D-alanine--poly(Phosphoribitol) ligase n=1 Tax=Actinomadura darangshiensis TaxID=705336 RepID=A0A4R5B4D4_9ACTN|nr:amino acid adenylation domain-containing protein [Actinomadura darangshiensis]TDD80671.1 D-alanine--poly(phosphoribitol) ligase [Actinomadura darangshiensis]